MRKIIRNRTSIALAVSLLPFRLAVAQVTSWNQPQSGYLHDALDRSIHSVSGFIGSAFLGPSVVGSLEWASIAPNRKLAIISRSGQVQWISDLANPAQALAFDGGAAVEPLWAADSSRVVFVGLSAELRWVGGFGSSQPAAQANWALPASSGSDSTATGPCSNPRREGAAAVCTGRQVTGWRLLAADAKADRVLFTRQNATNRPLWIASSTATPLRVVLPSVGSGEVVGAAALSSDGSSGFVAEVSSQQIYRIDNIAATPVFTALLDSSSPAGNPVDMVLSSDDQRLFVADSARISIRVLDARSGAQTAELPLDFAPSSFTRVSPDVYLVNYSGTAEGSLYLLDTGTSPRISFVPKGRLD